MSKHKSRLQHQAALRHPMFALYPVCFESRSYTPIRQVKQIFDITSFLGRTQNYVFQNDKYYAKANKKHSDAITSECFLLPKPKP
jgi:hypothetical protein